MFIQDLNTVHSKSVRIDFSIVDSLRGIAALYVTVLHCRGFLFEGLKEFLLTHRTLNLFDYFFIFICSLTKCGHEFVIIFFVLSGFSIAYSLHRQPKMSQFYFRRLIRLYPPYLGALAFAALVFLITLYCNPYFYIGTNSSVFYARIFESRDFLSLKNIALNLIYIPHGVFLAQFWSLTYEVIFYLLIPFYLLNKPAYYVVSTIGYVIGWILGGNGFMGNGILFNYAVHFNFYFMIGVFVFYNYNAIKKYFIIKNKVVVCIPAILLFFLMVAIVSKIGTSSKISSFVGAIFTIVLLVNFLEHSIRIKPFMFIGKISYTLYITHIASIYLFISILYNFTNVTVPISNRFIWVLGIPFCVSIAYLLYLLVEKNAKTLLDKLRSQSIGKTLV